jgi:hypothetical protein
MKKNIQHKKTVGLKEAGEAPGIDVRGICAAAKSIRAKHRSPLSFNRFGTCRRETQYQ